MTIRLDSCANVTPKFELKSSELENQEEEDDSEENLSVILIILLLFKLKTLKMNTIKGNTEFESHRKAHYDEYKMAQLLKSQLNDDQEDEEDEATCKYELQDEEMSIHII